VNISVSVEIESSKERVWNAITDIEHCTDMISGIKHLIIINKPETGLVGLKWQETRVMFAKEASETMWITSCKEQEFYCTRAENHGAIYVTTMSVKDKDNKTILTMDFSATSESRIVRCISTIFGIFMKKSMIKML